MRKKPRIERYYKNLTTGEYAELSGSPIAIKRIETKNWNQKPVGRKRSVIVKRVSKREFNKNFIQLGEIVKAIGYGYNYHPESTFRKDERNGVNKKFHQMSFYYQ